MLLGLVQGCIGVAQERFSIRSVRREDSNAYRKRSGQLVAVDRDRISKTLMNRPSKQVRDIGGLPDLPDYSRKAVGCDTPDVLGIRPNAFPAGRHFAQQCVAGLTTERFVYEPQTPDVAQD